MKSSISEQEDFANHSDLIPRLKILAVVMAVLFVCCGALTMFTCVTLKPWEVGVMQTKFGPGKGYHEGYQGGHTYLRMPFRDVMIHVPVKLLYLAIHADRTPDGHIVEGTGLVVPTSDGQKVTTDVSIVYRLLSEADLPQAASNQADETAKVEEIQKAAEVVNVEVEAKETKTLAEMAEDAKKIGYHGGPRQLITQVGINQTVWMQKVQQIAEDGCKRALGHLTVDGFYDSQAREAMAYMAMKMLNEGWVDAEGAVYTGLHAYGAHIEAVLVRAYTYPEVINKAIFNKVTQVQQASLNVAKEEMERQSALVTKVDAEGKANVEVKGTEGASEVIKIDSEADLYDKSKRAEGDLLVVTEKAAITEKKSKTFDLPGGDLYVARELKALPTKITGGILTDFNPLEITAWLGLISPQSVASDLTPIPVPTPAPIPVPIATPAPVAPAVN
jgi:hypothetical protein